MCEGSQWEWSICQYAICVECYDKNKPKHNRGSKDKTVHHSNTEKHEIT